MRTHISGNTLGSVVFYDEQYNALFDSDGASSGLWLYMEKSPPLVEYRPIFEDDMLIRN